MNPKPALDRGHIHTSSSAQQLPTPSESRERLVNRRAASKMQEHLGAYKTAFGQFVRLPQKWLRPSVPWFASCQKHILVSDSLYLEIYGATDGASETPVYLAPRISPICMSPRGNDSRQKWRCGRGLADRVAIPGMHLRRREMYRQKL